MHLGGLAEGVGFEPTMPFGHAGFQDRSHKPLDHPSNLLIFRYLQQILSPFYFGL